MTWETSDRRARLPPDWRTIRRRILERDHHECTWITEGRPCGAPATEVDHVIAGDDHRDENLRALCPHHHRRKSSSEGHAAQRARPGRNRPAEPHPGLA